MKDFIFMIPSLEAGGAESQLVKFAKDEKNNGFNPIVITLKECSGFLKNELVKNHITLKEYKFDNLCAPISFILLLFYFIKVDSKKFTLTAWMYHSMFVSIFIKILCPNIKVLWLIRRTQCPSGFTGILNKFNSFFSYIIPDFVICNAKAAVFSHVKSGYKKTKLKVIPNGIDIDNFKSITNSVLRQKYGISNSTKIFGVVARYAPIKGHFEFLSALKEIQNEDFVCFLVGRDILSAPSLQGFFSDCILSKKIIILGERTDIPNILSELDFLVSPSLSEGFPNVVAEAMACKTPCIVTDVGDCAVIVSETGCVVDRNDYQALVKSIQSWLVKPQIELDFLGDLAFDKIKSDYDVANVVLLYRDLI